jgi:hypothetical protein
LNCSGYFSRQNINFTLRYRVGAFVTLTIIHDTLHTVSTGKRLSRLKATTSNEIKIAQKILRYFDRAESILHSCIIFIAGCKRHRIVNKISKQQNKPVTEDLSSTPDCKIELPGSLKYQWNTQKTGGNHPIALDSGFNKKKNTYFYE